MARRVKFTVTLDLPVGVSIAEMRDYLLTEIKAGKGNRVPPDPMCDLDRDSIRVAYIERWSSSNGERSWWSSGKI